ncbi:hypothetical protein BgiMline_014925 [Biomphalaria glabrata]
MRGKPNSETAMSMSGKPNSETTMSMRGKPNSETAMSISSQVPGEVMASKSLIKVQLEDVVDFFLPPPNELIPGQITFEADVMEDEEEEKLREEREKEVGRVFRDAGDEFFHLYPSSRESIESRMKSLFSNLARVGHSAQEKDKEWVKFKELIRSTIWKETGVDARLVMGALMVCLRGMSALDARARQWAREFSLRFLREELHADNLIDPSNEVD